MFLPEVDTKMRACFRTVANIGSALVCSKPGWPVVLHCMLHCSCHRKSNLFLTSDRPHELRKNRTVAVHETFHS
jgi:hypothetical protein